MAESTQLREHALPPAAVQDDAHPAGRAWEKIRSGVMRTLLWSYERGTWQYDLLVLAILAIIFLTPRSWFHDRPTLQLTDLRHHQGFVEVGRGPEGWTYVVDARLVDSLPSQPVEEALRTILRTRLKKTFTLKAIDPIRNENNVILGYRVLIVFP
jgi:hypothetical protein